MSWTRHKNMRIERQIEQIIHDYLPAIENNQETIESVVKKFPEMADELRPRFEAMLWLRNARFALATRPGYIHDSRKYIEAKVEEIQPKGLLHKIFRQHTTQRWIFNIAAPVVIALLLALVINSAILTARLSIPGDPLYSTKLLLEDARLAFTFNPLDKSNLYMEYSRQRTSEFVELVLDGDYERLPAATNRMEAEIIASVRALNRISVADRAGQQPVTARLQHSLSNEIDILSILKQSSPPGATAEIEVAIQVAQAGMMALR
jgi:hypothetical protein